ncbi:phosphoribosylformylglycinamidine synthase [Saccharicrinis aurantiacus]|uniref:phosphoribosylformylglycinamidine synthase n=1 Tax=Saccharicrinis aurantiacus TaxID=1849719 RepID=UPI00094FB9F7|nr:phosphoribosylformylglycinamidine synthase [Saccharicrinis aurantiacus]
MVLFFKGKSEQILAVGCDANLAAEDVKKLEWAFSGATKTDETDLGGFFVGPRKEMITPWSTNAVEITQNMGIEGITRIEEYFKVADEKAEFDPMLQVLYTGLNQEIFNIDKEPDPIVEIDDVGAYNKSEGLALSEDEVQYLEGLAVKLGRKLTDSEVFGFSQVNSEHCRHKIFNGTFIIDGEEKESSLFNLIRRTSKENPNFLVSAYKDNVAFVEGPKAVQFAPASHDKPDYFQTKEIDTVLSLKAETHNFPTTVEPFNGAATGAGGEIRDRLGGGKASLPFAGTAVYMTSYSRSEEGRAWEQANEARPWLYQTPEQILIKASNGASDFGNKFGQPMICGSVLTFEHFENQKKFAFDKVIMLAGGIGFAKKSDALKDTPDKGDKVVLLGGDNYRIGMGGGAVSSVATGEFDNAIELNAVQRSNPEMQKRAMNAIRAMSEADENPIVLIHDHGAGGHLNCLSELVEETGGVIDLDKLPVGDPTLSAKEIAGNESQERMGLVLKEKDIDKLKAVADRERSPMYVVGETTGDMSFVFKDSKGNAPINWQLSDMFGNPPKTIMEDKTVEESYEAVSYDASKIEDYLKSVLQLEAVASKDWLTNKVDRSVTGKVAKQQCAGEIQIPLNNLGATSIDYTGTSGLATSVGHAPAIAMIDPAAGSKVAIAESLTNLVWAPFARGVKGISLSANWMWPCKNEGEDARLYKAVEAVSEFACDLGINIPTGKDSLSMTQKYKDGEQVISPGTVIISAAAEVSEVRQIVEPVLKKDVDTKLIYIDLSFDALKLGGSSFAQVVNKLGAEAPTVADNQYFLTGLETLQSLIKDDLILAGHDISAGGMVTAMLEMCFANKSHGLNIDLSAIEEQDLVKVLFAENPGVLIQVKDEAKVTALLTEKELAFQVIGSPVEARTLSITKSGETMSFDIDEMRDTWYKTSYLLDRKQSGEAQAKARFENYKQQPLQYKFNADFAGTLAAYGLEAKRNGMSGVKAAIIREKGVNGDREMAYSMYLAGFDVKDVHMTDLITGRETLEDVNFIVFVGGFSNSDVLGSAKGWAGAFLYNQKAKAALDAFYARPDTLSLGICNGCQLMVELGLVYPNHDVKPTMEHNDSHKFESNYVNMNIQDNNSVMLKTLAGNTLGVWIAHGEGKFNMPKAEAEYNIAGKYAYDAYPANPNGSDFSTAAIVSNDGRHLAMMPHLERAIFPWQCAHYPEDRKADEVTPWIEAFVNARKWVEANK